VKAPPLLLPNVTFEANLILKEKNKALLIPRNCLVNDSTVLLADGKEQRIKTGLKDYRMIEVLNGLQISDKLLKPKK
jgi:HlyD family secretion protein